MSLIYDKKDRIVTITFNRPEVLNALDPETFIEFSNALIKFRDDAEAWVAIITGAGERAFSSGFDIKKFSEVKVTQAPPIIAYGLDIWKPIIAAINGAAIGGGLEIALACDLRVASENAILGLTEVRWGLMPGWGGTQRLPRIIPYAKAIEMIFTGATIDANKAYQYGLLNDVVPSSKLMDTVNQLAAKICENGPLGVRAAKEAMVKGLNKPLEDGITFERFLAGKLQDTKDASEGTNAFKEKRKPIYTGE